jgi:hypothetical protein
MEQENTEQGERARLPTAAEKRLPTVGEMRPPTAAERRQDWRKWNGQTGERRKEER